MWEGPDVENGMRKVAVRPSGRPSAPLLAVRVLDSWTPGAADLATAGGAKGLPGRVHSLRGEYPRIKLGANWEPGAR